MDGLVVALAIGTALSLAVIDVLYVFNGSIARIYLLDAAVEGVFAVLLLMASRRLAGQHRPA